MYVKRKRKNRQKIIPALWKVEFAQWEEIIKEIKHLYHSKPVCDTSNGRQQIRIKLCVKGGKKNKKKDFVSENCKATIGMIIVIITNL